MEIVLDNAKLNSMRGNKALTDAFPFLTFTVRTGATCCHKGNDVPDYNGIRTTISNLPYDRQQLLKQLLGATKVTVHTTKKGTVTF